MTAEAGLLSTAFNAHGYRFAYGATRRLRSCVPAKCPAPGVLVVSSLEPKPLCRFCMRTHLHRVCLSWITIAIWAWSRQFSGPSPWNFGSGLALLGQFFENAEVVSSSPVASASGAKAQILQSLVFPRLLYGAGAWPPLSRGDAHKFQATVLGMYRQLFTLRRKSTPEHVCDLCSGAAAPTGGAPAH